MRHVKAYMVLRGVSGCERCGLTYKSFFKTFYFIGIQLTWEAWVQSLGWEDALEKGKATHSSILA